MEVTMKVLVTGYNGQLGYDVVKRLWELDIESKGVDVADFDLTNKEEVQTYIKQYNPDIVVHCAAYTAVDKAEDEKELCYAVNVLGTQYIAEVCKELEAKMVYISTDYVFNGEGEEPFEVDSPVGAKNQYGLTKYQGELEVQRYLTKYFIVRVSWVFGINGNNFIKTMLRLGKERDELNVIDDQVGSPTYTLDIAKLIADMIQTDKYGVYHASNEGYCSWYEFTKEIFRQAGYVIKVNPITTDQYPTKATRPLNSRMSKKSLDEAGFERLSKWEDALKRYLHAMGEQISE